MKVPKDLVDALPTILWMYQMGLVVFWIYDHSEGQRRSQRLVEKSIGIVMFLLKVASLPLMRPARKLVLNLVDIVEKVKCPSPVRLGLPITNVVAGVLLEPLQADALLDLP